MRLITKYQRILDTMKRGKSVRDYDAIDIRITLAKVIGSKLMDYESFEELLESYEYLDMFKAIRGLDTVMPWYQEVCNYYPDSVEAIELIKFLIYLRVVSDEEYYLFVDDSLISNYGEDAFKYIKYLDSSDNYKTILLNRYVAKVIAKDTVVLKDLIIPTGCIIPVYGNIRQVKE